MNKKKKDFKPSARRLAREQAMQAVYAFSMYARDIKEIEQSFLIDHFSLTPPNKVDRLYFSTLLQGTVSQLMIIDETLNPFLERSYVDTVELSILRVACYELLFENIDFKIVLNEAIEIAKVFGSDESYKYINGVLDKVARKLQNVKTN